MRIGFLQQDYLDSLSSSVAPNRQALFQQRRRRRRPTVHVVAPYREALEYKEMKTKFKNKIKLIVRTI